MGALVGLRLTDVAGGFEARPKAARTAPSAAVSHAAKCSRTSCATALSIFCSRDFVVVVMQQESHSDSSSSTGGLNGYPAAGRDDIRRPLPGGPGCGARSEETAPDSTEHSTIRNGPAV